MDFRAHLSAGLGSYETSDGAEVVIVCPDEDPEQGRFGSAPVHGFSLAAQLHLHWRLTPGVSFWADQKKTQDVRVSSAEEVWVTDSTWMHHHPGIV